MLILCRLIICQKIRTLTKRRVMYRKYLSNIQCNFQIRLFLSLHCKCNFHITTLIALVVLILILDIFLSKISLDQSLQFAVLFVEEVHWVSGQVALFQFLRYMVPVFSQSYKDVLVYSPHTPNCQVPLSMVDFCRTPATLRPG